jgi:hypothetical protein
MDNLYDRRTNHEYLLLMYASESEAPKTPLEE